MDELKPCPFCGRDATTYISVDTVVPQEDCIKFSVCCPACHVEQHIDICNRDTFEAAQEAMAKAIKDWNRRYGDGNS